MNTDTKKSVEFQLLLTPRIEALALPFDQKSATRNPRQYKPIRRVVLCSAGIFPKKGIRHTAEQVRPNKQNTYIPRASSLLCSVVERNVCEISMLQNTA